MTKEEHELQVAREVYDALQQAYALADDLVGHKDWDYATCVYLSEEIDYLVQDAEKRLNRALEAS